MARGSRCRSRGAVCYWACTWLKLKLGYDDSLDVFGVHGVGGLTGTLLAGVLAVGALSATSAMLYGIVVTIVWSGAVTWIILKVIALMVPLRVRNEDEVMGLDVSQHGEALQ